MSDQAPCTLEITQHEFEQITAADSVVIREFEREDGSRFAQAINWGSSEEMKDLAERSEILIVPVGVHVVCQRAVKTLELLKPKKG